VIIEKIIVLLKLMLHFRPNSPCRALIVMSRRWSIACLYLPWGHSKWSSRLG